MEVLDWIHLILQVLAGIAVCIPLVIKLCNLVRECHQAKAWKPLLELLMVLMQQAELKFADGATRKEYVMAMIQASSEYLSCPIDMSVISKMIDDLCDFSYVVNPPIALDAMSVDEDIVAPESAEPVS